MQDQKYSQRCYTQFGVYNHASCASYTTVNAGSESDDEHYDLTIAGAKQSYVLTATAKADGSQAKDEDCKTLTLTHLREKGSTPPPAAGADNPCW